MTIALWLGRALLLAAVLGLGGVYGWSAHAQTVDPAFEAAYELTDLGPVPGVPPNYGGLTFLAGDPDTLLIGGNANDAAGAIYSITLVRDGDGHITGFTGTAALFAAAPYIDGGLVFGPANVLFYTRNSTNEIGQIETGSTTADRVIDLTALGVSPSVGGLFFVLEGPGIGEMKIVSFDTGEWYSAFAMSDAQGTYDFLSVELQTTVSGGPEGIAFVPQGAPLFPPPNSMLLAERNAGRVSAYELDDAGNPIPASRTEFITDLPGAEGAVVDTVTGDFLFSTFAGNVVAVRAQPAEPTATVEPEANPMDTLATVEPVALPETGAGAAEGGAAVWSAVLTGIGLAAAALGLTGLVRRRGT